jgi:hypothetical protein
MVTASSWADHPTRTRTLVVGDPQASFQSLMAVLLRHDVLDGTGRIRDEVELVVVGDYFDYDLNAPQEAGAEGVRILQWLAVIRNRASGCCLATTTRLA